MASAPQLLGSFLDACLERKTVRRWLRRAWEPQQRAGRGSCLNQWEEFVRGWAPEVGFNASVLYREFVGRATRASTRWWCAACARCGSKQVQQEQRATVRFETDPGQQAQVDWGSSAVWLGEQRVCVHQFVMVLGYSGRIYGSTSRG